MPNSNSFVPIVAISSLSLSALIILSSSIVGLGITATQPATSEALKPNTISIDYTPTVKHKSIKESLAASGAIERAAATLNRNLDLKGGVLVVVTECKTPNAFYISGTIKICYELLERNRSAALSQGMPPEQATQIAVDAALATFLHESGHLLSDRFDLPYTGSPEDAADEFMIVAALQGIDRGETAIKSLLLIWAVDSRDKGAIASQANGNHRVASQRFYASACLLIGSNPEKYQPMATGLDFGRDRISQCKRNYAQASTTWNKFLSPHKK